MGQVEIWPHDLVTFANDNDFITENPLPEWAKDSLSKARIAVVRRGEIKNELVPVGLRGYERNQRLAGYLKITDIKEQYHPDYFIQRQSWEKLPVSRQKLVPFRALAKINPLLKDYRWGISGSLVYEMATGVKMVKESAEHTSDLDLIMPNLSQMSVKQAQEFLQKLNQFGVHADVQVVHGQRGFSLEEYALGRDQAILIKTEKGPILSKDPWQAIQK